MSRIQTVVEIPKPVYNEKGEQLDVDDKPMNPVAKKQQTPQYRKELYFLLHWGLETNFTYDQAQNPIPYTSTVGIVQHIETGVIETFIPGVMTVIGHQHENLKK